ncbi:hypothetical protein TVAGG3_0443910 [Trichomonas vaginalis G3]|uniref:hypothetical protein n=1 Tax=Trichomonas vaginalis (strain ATCC PRA-98 / G3) TaxID=412133 RepID=UPI0021E56C58|nr:hypothetical protein TVAGG3_0443910 [Trichomonas vaginalis G3]KAI5537650.1 hypothetical protein TVAGG3_0443910 [Trichomonas vaginalis G3]
MFIVFPSIVLSGSVDVQWSNTNFQKITVNGTEFSNNGKDLDLYLNSGLSATIKVPGNNHASFNNEHFILKSEFTQSDDHNSVDMNFKIRNTCRYSGSFDLYYLINYTFDGRIPVAKFHSYYKGILFKDSATGNMINFIANNVTGMFFSDRENSYFNSRIDKIQELINKSQFFYFGWEFSNVQPNEELSLGFTIDDGSSLDPSPIVRLAEPIQDYYAPGNNVPIKIQVQGAKAGQVIETYVESDEDRYSSRTPKNTFTVSEDQKSTTFTFTMRSSYIGNSYFKIYAMCNNTLISNVISGTVLFAYPPSFNLTETPKSIYYPNSVLRLKGQISDDTTVRICYNINNDTKTEVCSKTQYNAYNKNLNEIFNIGTNINEGNNSFYIYAKDDQDVNSPAAKFGFQFVNKITPKILNLTGIHENHYYAFHEYIDLNLTVQTNAGDMLSVYYYYDQQDPKYVDQFSSEGQTEYSFRVLPIPEPNSWYHKLKVFVTNQDNVSSTEIVQDIRVEKQDIFIQTNTLEEYYAPGAQVTIEGYFQDFKSGHKISVYYNYDRYYDVEIPNVVATMNESCISDIISFTIPFKNSSGYQNIEIYGRDKQENDKSESTRLRILTNIKPELRHVDDIEASYSINSFITVTFTVWDDMGCYLGYIFDDGQRYELDENLRTEGEKTYTMQIPTEGKGLTVGQKHKLTILIVDNYNLTSNNISFEFNYDSRNAPSIYVEKSKQNPYYLHFRHDIFFNITSNDKDNGNNVTVYAVTDYNEPIVCWEYTSNAENQSIVYALPNPHSAGNHWVAFYASDQTNASSEKTNLTFYINRDISIDFNKTGNYILPRTVNPEHEFTLTGVCYDFDVGQPISIKFELFKGYFSDNAVYTYDCGSFIPNDHCTATFSFNLVIPELNDDYQYKFTAIQGTLSGYTSQTLIRISREPSLYDLVPIDEEYTKGESITISGKVYDENQAEIYYYFDDNTYAASKLITVNTNNKTVPFTAVIKTTDFSWYLPTGPHILNIYAQDSIGTKCEVHNFTFIYDDELAPNLTVNKYDESKKQYRKNDEITFNISANDLNYGDPIFIYLKVNTNENIELFNLTSTRVVQTMNYTYNVGSTPGHQKLSFIAKNNNQSVSNQITFELDVLAIPRLFITTQFEKRYDLNKEIAVKGYAEDFKVGSAVDFYYKLNNNEEKHLDNKLIVNENSKTDEFTFSIQLPNEKQLNNITFYAKHDEQQDQSELFTFFTSNLPKIIAWNDFKDKYSLDEKITLNLETSNTDQNEYKLSYKFDDEDEIKLDQSFTDSKINLEISIPESLTNSKHRLTLFVYDENNFKSEPESKEFDYKKDNRSPEISVQIVYPMQSYVQNEIIKFKVQSKDFNNGNTVKIHLKEGDNDQVIHEYTSNGDIFEKFEYNYTIIKEIGIIDLIFVAIDNEDASSEQNVTIKIRKIPELTITSELKSYYSPNEDLIIKGYVTDYKQTNILSLRYQKDDYSATELLNNIKITDKLRSDEFSTTIRLPSKIGIHNFFLSVIDDEQKSSKLVKLTLRIHVKPEINLLNFSKNQTEIKMNVKVEIHQPVSVYYSFDNDEKLRLTSIEESKEVELKIPLKSDLTNDYHSVHVVLIDEYNLSSEVVNHSFFYSIQKPEKTPLPSPIANNTSGGNSNENSEEGDDNSKHGFFNTPFGKYGLWIILVAGIIIICIVIFFVVKAIIRKKDRESESEFSGYREDLNKTNVDV